MAQESLLRLIFKRGLLSTKPKKAVRNAGDDNYRLLAGGPTDTRASNSSLYPLNAKDVPNASLPVKVEAQQSTSDINSGSSPCSSCSSDAETIHTSNVPMPIPQQISSPPTFNVRDLLHAVIEEANTATTMHMETLNTTLALLTAIQGLSATVDVLKREMEEKKEVCEEMRRELQSFEQIVREMGFVE